jgi:hypothetical protein
MKKVRITMIVMLALVAIGLMPIQSQAITMTGDRDQWIDAVSFYGDVNLSGYPEYSIITAGSPIALPYGQTLSFDVDMEVRQVGSGWATWSNGNTPRVLYTMGATSVSGSFSAQVPSFGMEIEPNPFAVYAITLTLSNGKFLTQSVDGDSGAAFFGYFGGMNVVGFNISSEVDFAIGRMIEGGCTPVPLPGALLLVGSGLLGIVGLRRRS